MVKEQYVRFETAKLLKNKGFDGYCQRYYQYLKSDADGNGAALMFASDLNGFCYVTQFLLGKHFKTETDEVMLAPTQSLVMRWLRETHHLFVSIYTFDYQFDSYGWMFLIKPLRYTEGIGWCWDTDHVQEKKWSNDKVYKTYEEACEGAIKCCLINLI